MSLRFRLILIFLAATVAPLAATWWLTTSLLEQSLSYSSTDQLDRVSRMLEQTARELYQHTREELRQDAAAHRLTPHVYTRGDGAGWPPDVRAFADSGERERFSISDDGNNVLQYYAQDPDGVRLYSRPLGVDLARLSNEFRRARGTVDRARERDLRRGFVYTYLVVAASVWLLSFAGLMLMAHRFSGPIRQLTAGLGRLAAGDLGVRIPAAGGDEAGRAVAAFNETAAQLETNREKLVYLTQMASWQLLARKMAHELKNSLTPVRLTMEEIVARQGANRDPFIDQAARIVVDEVESLERRIRAFSQFATEPAVRPVALDVHATIEERFAFLKTGHPRVRYAFLPVGGRLVALADEDLLRGILTNLLENAADAAGPEGAVQVEADADTGCIVIEVRDSGPGLSAEARRSLFEPSISFKKGGMGLGLSIARKNALLMGGDIALLPGGDEDSELTGAAFRVVLPAAATFSDQLSISGEAGASISPQEKLPEHQPVADR